MHTPFEPLGARLPRPIVLAQGAIAREVESGLGPARVLGVIPDALTPREISSDLIGDTRVVGDMHERKVGCVCAGLMRGHATSAHVRVPVRMCCTCECRACTCCAAACHDPSRRDPLISLTARPPQAMLAKHSDAFIAMPGGFGTLEELMEARFCVCVWGGAERELRAGRRPEWRRV